MDEGQARLLALVAAGGAGGSVLRYAVTGLLTKGDFPWGTFGVNFSGTLLIALLFFYTLDLGNLPAEARVFLFVGVFGGYTTFSTFGLETVELAKNGQLLLSLANVALNSGLCVAGAFVGAALGILLAGGANGY
jgi:fluoride exporter